MAKLFKLHLCRIGAVEHLCYKLPFYKQLSTDGLCGLKRCKAQAPYYLAYRLCVLRQRRGFGHIEALFSCGGNAGYAFLVLQRLRARIFNLRYHLGFFKAVRFKNYRNTAVNRNSSAACRAAVDILSLAIAGKDGAFRNILKLGGF